MLGSETSFGGYSVLPVDLSGGGHRRSRLAAVETRGLAADGCNGRRHVSAVDRGGHWRPPPKLYSRRGLCGVVVVVPRRPRGRSPARIAKSCPYSGEDRESSHGSVLLDRRVN